MSSNTSMTWVVVVELVVRTETILKCVRPILSISLHYLA